MPNYKAPCEDLKCTPNERRSGVTILEPSQALRKFFARAGAIQRSQATCRLNTGVFSVFATFCKFLKVFKGFSKENRIFERFWKIFHDFFESL